MPWRLFLTGLPLLFGMLLALSVTLLATLRGIVLGDLSLPAHLRWLGAACTDFMLLALCRRALALWFCFLEHLVDDGAPRWSRVPPAALVLPRRERWPALLDLHHPALCVAAWRRAIDTIAWPLASVAAHLALLYLVTVHGLGLLLVWWMFFTLLDLAAALGAVAVERESPRLLPYVTLYRMLVATSSTARRSLVRFRPRIAPQPRCGAAHGAAGGPSPFGKG